MRFVASVAVDGAAGTGRAGVMGLMAPNEEANERRVARGEVAGMSTGAVTPNGASDMGARAEEDLDRLCDQYPSE